MWDVGSLPSMQDSGLPSLLWDEYVRVLHANEFVLVATSGNEGDWLPG